MQGFKPGKHSAKPKNYADGGIVRGPGTGTSDSVPAMIPKGGYVMPADSTKALGFRPGARLAQLSDGEAVLTPEQVQMAGGFQALDAARAATHTPVPDKNQAGEPKFFFAGGGREDEQTAPNSFGDAAAAAANPAVTQVATGQPRPGASAADQIPNSAPPGWKGGTGDRVTGNDFTRNVSNTMNALGPVAGSAAPLVAGMARGIAGGARVAAASPIVEKVAAYGVPAAGFGAVSAAANNEPAAPAQTAPMAAGFKPAGGPIATPAAPGTPSPASTPGAATPPGKTQPAAAPAPAPAQVAPGVYQHGRGQYSDSPDGIGFNPGFTGQPSAQNDAAAQTLADRSMLGFKPAGSTQPEQPAPGAGMYVAPDTGGYGLFNKDRLRERELQMAASSTKSGMESQQAYESRIKGAVGALQNFQAERAAAPRNEAEQAMRGREIDLRGQEVAQRGEQMRSDRGFRAGQLANDSARTALDAKKTGQEMEARGFEIGQAKRMETLRAQYESATDPKVRADLEKRIRVLSGKDDQANRFTVVPGGQEWDATAGVMRNVPGRVLNNQTGQFVDGAGAGKALPPLKDNTAAMTIVNDPSLSKEQRAAKLREMGYN